MRPLSVPRPWPGAAPSLWLLLAAAALPLAVAAQDADPASDTAASSDAVSASALAVPNRASSERESDDQQQRVPDPTPDPATEEVEQTLSSFLSGQRRILLQGEQAQVDVNLPLPSRWEPRALTLKLQYRNSVSLVGERSQLSVALNGLIIAQFALDPQRPDGEARIRLPLDLLQKGYNQLSFAVAQNTEARSCQDPQAPELWTQIDTEKSTLTLSYRRLPLVDSLAELSAFADRHRWGQARLRILIPLQQGQASDEQLLWGALVAQAAAIQLQFQPLEVRFESIASLTGLAPRRAGDMVLVGTRDQLQPVLGEDWAATVTNAYLGIRNGRDSSAEDRGWSALVVSGRDQAEVTRAAIALGMIEQPLPDAPEALIDVLKLPDIPADIGPGALVDGAIASFADLGVPTTTLTSPLMPARLFPGDPVGGVVVDLPTSLGVDFWVPAGFFPGRPRDGVLTLNFNYGARLRGDSVLNLSLNGVFVRAIPLVQPAGSVDRGYEVRFPLALLRPGRNRLELSPMMVPSDTSECELRQGENLLLTIGGESTLQLPPGRRLATLPDLDLLARAGYPWLRDPTGGGLAVRLTDKTAETISAAWTLLGRMAQVTGLPLYRATIGEQPKTDGRGLLIVGTVAALPSELLGAAPISWRAGRTWIDYPALQAVLPEQPTGSWAERGLARIQRWLDPPSGAPGSLDVGAALAPVGDPPAPPGTLLGAQGALLSFESPTEAGQTVLLLTARTPELLQVRTARLVQPDFWYNLKGALVLWEDTEHSLLSRPPQRRFTVGEVAPSTWLSHLLSAYPAALIGITLLLVLLIASLLFGVTGRLRRRRHAGGSDDG